MHSVNIRRVGKPTVNVTVAAGSTVQAALDAAGIEATGQFLLDGRAASLNDTLTGAEVTLVVTEGQPKGA